MSRFFRTAVPQLGTDFMFDVPWDEVSKTMETQQATYENNVKNASLLKNALNVAHLNTDFDNEAVRQAKEYYGGEISNIVNKLMSDPAARVTGEMMGLSSDLEDNLKNGILSKVQGRYNSFTEWQKANEKMKSDNPDLYNKAYTAGMNSLNNSYATAGHSAKWSEDNIMEDIDWSKDINEIIKGMEPDMIKNGYANVGGQWIYKGSQSNKVLSQNRILQAVENKIKSNPKYAGYAKQRGRYGIEGYTDALGNIIPMFSQDESGKIVINNKSAFAAPLKHATAFAYSQSESEQDVKENPYAMEATRQAGRKELQDRQWKREDDKEKIEALFYGTTNTTTPEQKAAQINDVTVKYQSQLKAAGIKPSGDIQKDLLQYKALLERANTKDPKTRAMINTALEQTRNDIYNLSKNEVTTGFQALAPNLEKMYGKQGAFTAIKKTADAYGKLFEDVNLFRSTPGTAVVTVTHPDGYVTRTTMDVNSLDQIANKKFPSKGTNVAIQDFFTQINSADSPVTLKSAGVTAPQAKIFTTDPNYVSSTGKKYADVNGVSKKFVHSYKDPTNGSVGLTNVEIDYMISFSNAGVDPFSPRTITGHQYQQLESNAPVKNGGTQSVLNFNTDTGFNVGGQAFDFN